MNKLQQTYSKSYYLNHNQLRILMIKTLQNSEEPSEEPFSRQIFMKNYDDNQQCKDQTKKAPSFKELPIQESQSQQDILDQIDDILEKQADQKMTKKQMLLNFKVNQLHKICQTLSDANKKLTQKLECMSFNEKADRSQTSQSGIFTDQLTQMQGQFTQIQTLLTQYKNELKNSQAKWNTLRQLKDQQISQLKKQLIVTQQRNQQLQTRLKQKQEDIFALQNRNEELLVQMQNIQIQREEIQERDSRSYSRQGINLNYDHKFNERIQAQLEVMIQKLLKELSHQKKINSRMNMQIKRLNNQILNLEKSLKLKNQSIYQLELKLIRSNKTSQVKYVNASNYTPKRNNKMNANSSGQYRRNIKDQIVNPQFDNEYFQQKYIEDDLNNLQTQSAQGIQYYQQPVQKPFVHKTRVNTSQNQNRRNETQNRHQIITGANMMQNNRTELEQKNKFLSFTLMDLQNKQIKIRTKQKILIASKLILIYCKKIKANNYYNLIAEQIQIYNYNAHHSNLLRVRVINSTNRSTLLKENEESLLWNMAFIVQTLLNEVQSIDSSESIDLNLSQVIQEILSQTVEQKVSYFEELSKSLEASIQ